MGLVAIAEWKYPFPSRTRKSSALTPMVLQRCGRVGSRQALFFRPPPSFIRIPRRASSLPSRLHPRTLRASRTARTGTGCYGIPPSWLRGSCSVGGHGGLVQPAVLAVPASSAAPKPSASTVFKRLIRHNRHKRHNRRKRAMHL